MKKLIPVILLFLLFTCVKATAQNNDYKKLFRFYYDNDFINILGNGTDRAYTGGTRLDYFFVKEGKQHFFLDRWMPKAIGNAINTYNWSLMQVAYTPNIIAATEPAVNDYPYSSGLYIIHGLHSSSAVKKYNLQTEVLAGISGPYSYSDEVQTAIHKIIKYQEPMGWKYQMPTDLLLNLNLGAEKMLYQPTKWIEIIGGAKAMVGTMQDGIYANALIRIGKMNPYFDGLITQYATSKKSGRKRFQAYAFFKPAIEWTAYNALLDGGIFRGRSDYYRTAREGEEPYTVNKNINPAFDGGFVLSLGKIGFSFTQKILAPQVNGYDAQVTGNVSLHIGF